jgi:hypothetical protein
MKKKISERLMTTKQQVDQINYYWKDLSHLASDDVKKKSMDRRFGIKNIKLDRYGNIISFDKYKRGANEDHDCNDIHPEQSHKEWEKEQKEGVEMEENSTEIEDLGEALSPSQRRKMGIRMRILAKKPAFIMKRKRMMKRAANKETLLKRARKAAIKKVVKKFYPKLRGKKTSDLSYAERGKISDIVKKKAAIITRFAKRMIKDVRKKDVERRKNMNKSKDKK